MRVLRTEIVGSSYKFMMLMSSHNNQIEFVIEGREVLETLFRVVGRYSVIAGLEQMLISFKKIGEGAFAKVYEAVNSCQQKFALKGF